MIPVLLGIAFLSAGTGGPPQSLPHSYASVAAPAKPHVKPRHAPDRADPYGIYDGTSPSDIPYGKNQALYADGAYAATVTDTHGHPHTLWFSVTGYDYRANVLDVETSDAGWWQAGPWAAAAYKAHPHSPVIVYCELSNWSHAEASVREYAPHVPVKWWLANPTQVAHLVPGSDATQWYWGQFTGKPYDISMTAAGFWNVR